MTVETPADTTTTKPNGPPLLEMRHINVAFGGVHAVRDATIDLHEGEVMGLVGGNGAGKSTLIRTLSGAHRSGLGRDPDRWQAGRHHQSARCQSPEHRDASTRPWRWPTTSMRRPTCSLDARW